MIAYYANTTQPPGQGGWYGFTSREEAWMRESHRLLPREIHIRRKELMCGSAEQSKVFFVFWSRRGPVEELFLNGKLRIPQHEPEQYLVTMQSKTYRSLPQRLSFVVETDECAELWERNAKLFFHTSRMYKHLCLLVVQTATILFLHGQKCNSYTRRKLLVYSTSSKSLRDAKHEQSDMRRIQHTTSDTLRSATKYMRILECTIELSVEDHV